MTTRKKLIFALTGGALLAVGVLLIGQQPYRAKTVIASASGCNMRVDVVEPVTGQPQGYVVLFHGLSANKRIMFYLAQGFANQNLRVFLPDFPGHGGTPGPFSFARADSCGQSLVNELIERRAIAPIVTILAGHSMGGSIAMRVASRVPVAGVIAISPAPMHSGYGVSEEMLPFLQPITPPNHTFVARGAWEPERIRDLDRDYLVPTLDNTSAYRIIPVATHVSLLFDSDLVRANREWISQILPISADAMAPRHAPVLGLIVGLAGLCILVVPFLIETVAPPAARDPEQPVILSAEKSASPPSAFREENLSSPAPELEKSAKGSSQHASFLRVSASSLLQIAVASILAAAFLHFFVPLRFLHVFEGDYLASFFLIGGTFLLLFNFHSLRESFDFSWRPILLSGVAVLALILLFGGWFDLTFYEAFLTLPRWLRLPAVALALLPWQIAEQLLLGPIGAFTRTKRVLLGTLFRIIPWLVMTAALLYFHSGQILIALLSAYFLIFFVLQRMAVDVVHRETRSATAAAVFGAILFAGLALAIFPVA